ncbi:hypothetical protein E6C50_01945 [Flavobacterium supellecticarium]|uniref:Uncharacterized protein n=1 Tax=Flavobacterium supellecticarium TaxID=2565924 RepID=A0A4S4A3Y9_9FLAO|nr:hypothetical protein [Flavobacterium supellecticarium]THF52993.1 hypothetical protein E6C50_01945 [Flavobacterium supellecticarium]
MARIYKLVKRTNRIIYFETSLVAFVLTILLWKKMDHHWTFLLLTFPIFEIVFILTFFRVAFMRYLITILFSIIYGLIVYFIGRWLQQDGVTVSVVFSFLAYFYSLYLHKDHFDYIKNSDVVEIEYE